MYVFRRGGPYKSTNCAELPRLSIITQVVVQATQRCELIDKAEAQRLLPILTTAFVRIAVQPNNEVRMGSSRCASASL